MRVFRALGRLKPGTTLEQAIAELDTIAADLARRYPDSNARPASFGEVAARIFRRRIPPSSLSVCWRSWLRAC